MAIDLTNEQIETIGRVVVKQQRKQGRKQKKLEHDRRLRNTRLLLSRYRELSDHIQLSEVTEAENISYELEHGTVVRLDSLGKYHEKSRKLIEYLNTALKMYKERCINWDEAAYRRYRTIEWLYLSTTRLNESEIAHYYKVDRSVITRDKARAINEISILLFGIDAVIDSITP